MTTTQRYLQLALFLIIAACLWTSSSAAPRSIEGEYVCVDCHGFLTIKSAGDNKFKVNWSVGGGSCGGEVVFDGLARLRGDVLEGTYKLKKKQCVASFEFSPGGVEATDSCAGPEESSSTCNVVGTYQIRAK